MLLCLRSQFLKYAPYFIFNGLHSIYARSATDTGGDAGRSNIMDDLVAALDGAEYFVPFSLNVGSVPV
jgi:hypothetical protein